MTFNDSFTTALGGLQTNKFRSALTIFGIVIGITAIMLMMSIGRGAENLILQQIGGLGADTIVIRPGREPKGPTDIAETIFSDSLGEKEVRALERKENVQNVVDVSPVVIVPGSVSYEGETFRPTIIGGGAKFFADAFDVRLESGVFFGEIETRQRASVAVIGSKVKKELFGNRDALGKNIKIKNRKFRVVGVLKPKGQLAFFNFDELVSIPHTTAQIYLLGINHFHEIIIKTTGPEVVQRTVRDIELTLREIHNITDPEKDDFFVVTQQGVTDQVSTIIGALTAFLSSVVAIALVVGGIGVMNIMLVSVSERTREIGLRKALGATEKDIMTQFLLEAVMLTASGGIVGIALGAAFSFLVSVVLSRIVALGWAFSFPITAAILGLGVAALVGLVFGLYPARQASLKSPMEALRYE